MENSGHKTSWKQRQEYPLWREGEGGKEEEEWRGRVGGKEGGKKEGRERFEEFVDDLSYLP